MSEEFNEFSSRELSEESSDIVETQTDSAQGSDVEGQSETNPSVNTDEKALSPEDVLRQLAEEKPEVDQEFIDKLNALGGIHNGMPIKVNSVEEAKELMMKGFDYTKKSMAREEEYRLKEEGFSQKEAQYNQRETAIAQKEQGMQAQLQYNQIIGSIVARMETEDPELFSHLDRLYRNEETTLQRQMPFKAELENRFKQYEDKFKQLEAGTQQKELEQIKGGWAKELSEVQTKQEAQLNKLGIRPDWKKVESTWEADVTGKMTGEQALFAVYGSEILKANESRIKNLETKNKVNSKIVGRSGVGSSQKAAVTPQAAYGDYSSLAKQFIANKN